VKSIQEILGEMEYLEEVVAVLGRGATELWKTNMK